MKRIKRKKVRLRRIFISHDAYDYVFRDENEAQQIVKYNNVADVKFELAPYKWYELDQLRLKNLTDRQWEVVKLLLGWVLGLLTAFIIKVFSWGN